MVFIFDLEKFLKTELVENCGLQLRYEYIYRYFILLCRYTY